MKHARAVSYWVFLVISAVLVGWWLVVPLQLSAQTCTAGSEGQNAVWNPTCNGGTAGVQGSSAFLDATQFTGSPVNDACGKTQAAFATVIGGNSSPVIDSRGFISTAIPCASPSFLNSDLGTLYLAPGTWQAQNTWTLGGFFRLYGTGPGSRSGTINTNVQMQTGASEFAFRIESRLEIPVLITSSTSVLPVKFEVHGRATRNG